MAGVSANQGQGWVRGECRCGVGRKVVLGKGKGLLDVREGGRLPHSYVPWRGQTHRLSHNNQHHRHHHLLPRTSTEEDEEDGVRCCRPWKCRRVDSRYRTFHPLLCFARLLGSFFTCFLLSFFPFPTDPRPPGLQVTDSPPFPLVPVFPSPVIPYAFCGVQVNARPGARPNMPRSLYRGEEGGGDEELG